jgi:hypothetical protein
MDVGKQIYYRKDKGKAQVIVIEQPAFGEDWIDDPVHEDKDGWWFLDETWSTRYGPYESEKECRNEMKQYCIEVLGEKYPDG